jgi:hypothetical protein
LLRVQVLEDGELGISPGVHDEVFTRYLSSDGDDLGVKRGKHHGQRRDALGEVAGLPTGLHQLRKSTVSLRAISRSP